MTHHQLKRLRATKHHLWPQRASICGAKERHRRCQQQQEQEQQQEKVQQRQLQRQKGRSFQQALTYAAKGPPRSRRQKPELEQVQLERVQLERVRVRVLPQRLQQERKEQQVIQWMMGQLER
jgi:hypothetical protein